ncbi:MAG: S-adenosylmethionine decarboxylase, partial [Candidatus Pacebacteria bacterium]|nr:S-adenosylmethionine decarboxylase [Candidatus Paceibacterota bacterium]
MKKKTLKLSEISGYCLTLDLYDCEPKTVDNLKKGYSYLDQLPGLLKIKKISPPFILYTDGKRYPDKAGLSGWIPFITPEINFYSGASIHTLSPTNFISIDIYSFKKFDPEKIKKFTKK